MPAYLKYILATIFLTVLATTLFLVVKLSLLTNPTSLSSYLKPAQKSIGVEFISKTDEYSITLNNKQNYKQLINDLGILTAPAPLDNIKKLEISLTTKASDAEGQTPDHEIYDTNGNLVANARIVLYPNEKLLKVIIYIQPEWIENPTAATLFDFDSPDQARAHLISYQFINLFSKLNLNKEKPAQYFADLLNQWSRSDFSAYPFKISL